VNSGLKIALSSELQVNDRESTTFCDMSEALAQGVQKAKKSRDQEVVVVVKLRIYDDSMIPIRKKLTKIF